MKIAFRKKATGNILTIAVTLAIGPFCNADQDDLESMKVVHEHEFEGQQFLGSPAISGDAMFIRSSQWLYKIEKNNG